MRDFVRFVAALPRSLARALLIYLPGTSGILLRRWYYGRRLRRCGRGFTVLAGVHIAGEAFIEVGDDVMIRENAIVHAGVPDPADAREVVQLGDYRRREIGVLSIGDHARIAFGAVILAYGGVRIGAKCGVGPYAVVLSESFHHKGKDRTRVYKYSQGADANELCVLRGYVELMDGAGLASNVLVLPGATIGRDSWVAPNSVVRLGGFVESDVIAKGDPAAPAFRRHYAAARTDR